MRLPRPLLLLVTFALAACATPPRAAGIAALLRDAPDDLPARLTLAPSGEITAAAAPLGPGMLPRAVRVAFDAVAPGGQTHFVGREWGARGDGYRLEKHYPELPHQPERSVLAAADGSVLERWHTVPLAEVPHHVLATALRTGPRIEQARIVSGREAEEHWMFVVRDRLRGTFLVGVGLDGAPRGTARLLSAQLQVAD